MQFCACVLHECAIIICYLYSFVGAVSQFEGRHGSRVDLRHYGSKVHSLPLLYVQCLNKTCTSVDNSC